MATRASLEAHRLQWRPRWRLGPARWAGRSDSCPRPRRWAAPAPCRAARTEPSLISLLGQVQAGSVTVEQAAARLQALASGLQQVQDFAALDSRRAERTGFPEAVWGPGKTPEQICAIMEALSEREPLVLATRVSPDAYAAISAINPRIEYHHVARICALRSAHPERCRQVPSLPGTLVVVSAGTADLAVAEECRVVAQAMGCEVKRVADVGVAGLHRLLARLDDIRGADVVVVVAGMDGALPSVVAGLVEAPVIACPTSIGYGAALQGMAPLLSSLNSCSAGLTVVNIGNGFGAAVAAAKVLRAAQRLAGSRRGV